jgi:hypothetical protein
VGYGDRFPTTTAGRLIGVIVMFCGIALLGVLTSFLASFFIAPAKKKPAAEQAPDDPRARLAELNALWQAQEQAGAAFKAKLDEIAKLSRAADPTREADRRTPGFAPLMPKRSPMFSSIQMRLPQMPKPLAARASGITRTCWL